MQADTPEQPPTPHQPHTHTHLQVLSPPQHTHSLESGACFRVMTKQMGGERGRARHPWRFAIKCELTAQATRGEKQNKNPEKGATAAGVATSLRQHATGPAAHTTSGRCTMPPKRIKVNGRPPQGRATQPAYRTAAAKMQTAHPTQSQQPPLLTFTVHLPRRCGRCVERACGWLLAFCPC